MNRENGEAVSADFKRTVARILPCLNENIYKFVLFTFQGSPMVSERSNQKVFRCYETVILQRFSDAVKQ